MVALNSLDDETNLRQFSETVDPRENGLRQFRTMAIVWSCYVASAILLFGRSFATLLETNLICFAPFAMVVALLTFCIRRLLSRSEEAFSAWAKAYLSEFGPQFVSLNIAFVLGISAFSAIKTNIPSILPFYADTFLARLDLWLHGVYPWQYLHLMPQWMGGVIDFVYSRVWFAILIGGFTLSTLIYRGKYLKRFIWAVFLNYAFLGSVIAISLASVGPIYYDAFYPDAQFTSLTAALQANGELVFMKQYAAYLLSSYRTEQTALGTGISAMPSLHVAFAVLAAWLLTSWGRIWAVIGWLYASFILVGSVYTGWHYAVDGYVSAILVSAIWLALSRHYRLPLLPRRDRRSLAGGDLPAIATS